MERIRQTLKELEDSGLTRIASSRTAPVDFSSNDYLGLANDPQIRAQLIQALAAGIPLGATGSRLLRGTSTHHEETEAYLAKTFGNNSALLFGSGYAANLGLLSVLGGQETVFYSDDLNHASLIDGIRLSRSECKVYRHGDMTHLEERLGEATKATRKVIVTESVFSMDGDISDFAILGTLAKKFDAWLIADETHATGVFGLGLCYGRPELKGVRTVAVHAAGKALGAMGAFVLAPAELKQLMINRSRTFVFSTAISPLTALQIRLAMTAAISRPKLARQCLANAAYLRNLLPKAGGHSQIVPVLISGNERVTRAAANIQKKGFDVRAIRSPTVRAGSERLRISMKSMHSTQEIERLAQAIREELDRDT